MKIGIIILILTIGYIIIRRETRGGGRWDSFWQFIDFIIYSIGLFLWGMLYAGWIDVLEIFKLYF